MPAIISLSSGWEVGQVVGMVFCNESCRLSLIVIIVGVIFIIDFSFYIDELVSRFSSVSFTWPSLVIMRLSL